MSRVSNGDAASAVNDLIWASRQFQSVQGDLRWERFATASAKAETAVLNCAALAPCLKMLKELAAWAEYRRSGHLGPGMHKGGLQGRVGQLHSQLDGCVSTILWPSPQ